MKSNKGITLVALVITIIVLLILAGVSISLVVGDNGIMTRAKTAAEKTNEADALSAVQLAVSSLTSEYYAIKYTGTSTEQDGIKTYSTAADYVKAKLSDELTKAGYSGTVDAAGTGVAVKKTGATDDVNITLTISEGEITKVALTAE